MANVTIVIELPDDEVAAFLQTIRTWEAARTSDIDIYCSVKSNTMNKAEVQAMINNLQPPVPVQVHDVPKAH